MKSKASVLMLCAACLSPATPASAETVQKFECLDGAEFMLTVFDSRRTAFMQLDGRRYALKQRVIAIPGRKRYSKNGLSVSTKVSTKGDTAILRRAGKRTDCTLVQTG